MNFENKSEPRIVYMGTPELSAKVLEAMIEDGWNIVHTIVNPAYQGKSLAKRLVYCVLEQAEKRRIPVVATCSYARKILGEPVDGMACGLPRRGRI